jgi:pentatricopeptide repeat protein
LDFHSNRSVFGNKVSPSALLFDHIKSGKTQLAFAIYEEIHKDNPPESATLALLHVSAKSKDIGIGNRIHRIVERAGLLKTNHFIGSALVNLYAKCGSLSRAQELFDKLPVRDAVTWTALIGGYAEHGESKKSLVCFDQMQLEGVVPDPITFLCTLKACSTVECIHKGVEIHADIERQGVLEKSLALGSGLVDMYMTCGLLSKAQETFDKLPRKDVVTWNTLISGYVRCECGDKALECFEKMGSQGVSPNNVGIFVSALKACGSTRNASKGLEIHREIDQHRLPEKNLFVGSALIEMYAKCGLLRNARDVFDQLHVRNVVAWTTLIGGYVEHGYGNEALSFFEEMKAEGVLPNALTYVCSLKACGIAGELEKGCELHSEIESRRSLKANSFVGSSLLDMYVKCGCVAKAREVFDGIRAKDVVLWNALIGGYAEHGHAEEAVECLERMQAAGVTPNAVTLLCVLKACGSAGDVEKGKAAHDEIARQGLLRQADGSSLGSAMVHMYAKCGCFGEAKEILGAIPIADAVPWNALIVGYANRGFHDDALRSFDEMRAKGVRPDSVTLVCCLKACASLRSAEKLRELFFDEIRGLREERRRPAIGNALVDACVKCGCFDAAREVFAKLAVRDVVSWTALIAGHVDRRRDEEALELFRQMRRERIAPNAITLACGLKALGHARGGRAWGEEIEWGEIHGEISRQRLAERDPVVGNTLVDLYARNGELSAAQEVLEILPNRDEAAWTALISGFARSGHAKRALESFERMRLEGVLADGLAYACGLKACAMLGTLDKGMEMHAEIEKKHGHLSGGGEEEDDGDDDDAVIVVNTLVDMYAKCGGLAEARHVLDKLLVRNVVSWTALMAGYAHRGESDEVFRAFETMLGEAIEPDAISFAVVLGACGRKGLLDESKMYFDAMSESYGIAPAIEHHTCLVDLLSRVGRLQEALLLVRKLPPLAARGEDSGIWHALLSVCARLGSSELGRLAFRQCVPLA